MDELTREFLIESQEGLDRMERCLTELPALRAVGRAAGPAPRAVACWLQDGSAPTPAELARPEPGPDHAAAPNGTPTETGSAGGTTADGEGGAA